MRCNMRKEDFISGETPFDNGDFNTLAEIANLLRKLHSPYALNIEKTYNRLQFLEDKEKIQESLRAAEAGDVVDHEEVVENFMNTNTKEKEIGAFCADVKNAIKMANRNYEKVIGIRVGKDALGSAKKFLDIPVINDESIPYGMFELETEKTVLMMNQSDVR